MKHLAVMAACLIALTQVPAQAQAAEMTVKLNAAQPTGAGPAVGTVRVVETQYGLVFYPNLTGLMPGIHGFHVHENPSCAPLEKDGMMVPALAAGGHFDPLNSKHHGEPWGDGHLGDLPALYVMPDGSSTNPVLSPRLKKLSEIANRSLMVHVGGDNYSDHPAPVGGGGVRMACGVIEAH